MAALVFNKCCGCIELKTGCFIIGYFNLVIAIIFTIVALLGVIGGGLISADEDQKNQEVGLVVLIGSSVLMIILIVFLAFVITLLVGLHKNKPGHVKAYLIYFVIFIILYTVQFITGLIGGETNPGSIAQSIITILFQIYFALVIRSQYLHMKEPARGPAIYTA